jgi:hypothetical protein
MADRLVLPTDLYPVAPSDAPEQQPDKLKLLTNIVQLLAARSKLYPSQPRQQNTLLQPSPQPISTELRVDDASSTLYQLIVQTPL